MDSQIRATTNIIIHTGLKSITYHSNAIHSDIYIFTEFDGVFILMVIIRCTERFHRIFTVT